MNLFNNHNVGYDDDDDVVFQSDGRHFSNIRYMVHI